VSAGRGRSRRRRHIESVAHVKSPRHGPVIWAIILLFLLAGVLASANTPRGSDILTAVQRFLLFYSGVLALVALTAAVGAGVVAADRVVMTPGSRVVAQAAHRAVSFAALAFLVTHIVLEIFAHRSDVIDAFVPFLAHGRTFYIGLGTIASDLVVLLIATGIARGRFATRWPWTWRAIHATAYLAWPLAIVHGLLAGRTAKPYVDWSYGACLAAVALALVIRFVATIRSHREKAPHPLPGQQGETRLSVDWTRCRGHGLCAHLVPELVQLDGQGYPVFLDMPVPPWLQQEAQQAVQMCPSLALRTTAVAPPPPSREPAKARLEARKGDNLKLVASTRSESGPDVDVDEAWIAEITDVGRQIPGPIT